LIWQSWKWWFSTIWAISPAMQTRHPIMSLRWSQPCGISLDWSRDIPKLERTFSPYFLEIEAEFQKIFDWKLTSPP
jgi:hypothetical protein